MSFPEQGRRRCVRGNYPCAGGLPCLFLCGQSLQYGTVWIEAYGRKKTPGKRCAAEPIRGSLFY